MLRISLAERSNTGYDSESDGRRSAAASATDEDVADDELRGVAEAEVVSHARDVHISAPQAELKFRLAEFHQWYASQRLCTGIMVFLSWLGVIGVVIRSAGASSDGTESALASTSAIVNAAMFTLLRVMERRALRLANSNAASPDPDARRVVESLSAVQCSSYLVAFGMSLLNTAIDCTPENTDYAKMGSCNGFQHNIWPASFLVWYFMFPHMIVTIYRPHGYHVLPLLVLGFVVFPSVVGAILPARFGYNYAAAPALFIVLALNAWLAAHTWRTAAITGRLTYVSAAKERLAHAAAEGERRRAATVRRSLQRIAARERLLTDVVTFMSHHVRNPVHAISNLTGVVLSRIGKSDLMKPVPTSPGSSNAEDLSLVLQSATQLATLVDDIESLEILRMGSNEDKLELHTPAHMHSWLVAACSRATYGMRNNIDVALGLGVPDIVRFAKAGIGPVVRLALRHASTLAVERAEVSAEWAGGSGAALMEITISALAASADAKSLADQRPFIVLGAPLCHSRLAGAQASISMEWHALEWRCVINFPANSSRPVRMSTASTSLTPDGPVAEASTVPAGPPATAGPGVATTARSGGSGDAVSVSVAVGVAGAHAGAGSSASEARTAPAAHEPPRASFSPLAHSAPALWEEPPLLQSPSHNDFVPSPSLVAPRSRALRCLVVEDELINRKVIERMLHRLKCSFDTYADGAEVDVDAVVAGSHDVVLTDIIMPVMRGDTLCKRLRAAGFSRPIIACTANGSLADRAKYALDGFSDVLTKPYTLSRLNEVLARVCASA